ncbi:MAG TPA: hypothetical protein VMI09_06495 [Candidatus Binataceae bacterium]|nr:hypothetical protein [Candidatus Binataceae bacterium]
MKVRYAAALALVGWYLMIPPAMAMDCEKDSLSDVSGSGAILEMAVGRIYKVDDVDQVDSQLWLPGRRCAGLHRNEDLSGEAHHNLYDHQQGFGW